MHDEQPDDMFHYQKLKEEEQNLTAEEEKELDRIALDEEQLKHGEYPLIVE